jgi:aldose sugar dehydrogenase
MYITLPDFVFLLSSFSLLAGSNLVCLVLLTGIIGYASGFKNNVHINDPSLNVEPIFQGLRFPTDMTFLGANDILVTEKNDGTIKRIVNERMMPYTLLKVNVSNAAERGMLGIVSLNNTHNSTLVFVYFSESHTKNGTIHNNNRIYRYELVNNKLVNPLLIFDAPLLPGPQHNGGKMVIGPDRNLYVVIGDLNPQEDPSILTQTQNRIHGPTGDGRGGVLRFPIDYGSNESSNKINTILGNGFPLNKYYAYGIRNSFGLDFDPVTQKLWDTENGDFGADEINLVMPGFNGGWSLIQGMAPRNFNENSLVNFQGKGKYSDPEFVWKYTVGPTAIKFIDSNKLGKSYYHDLLVGDFHNGNLYHFKLNEDRNGLKLKGPLKDMISNNMKDLKGVILGKGFGGITDIENGPDGYTYILAVNTGGPNCPIPVQKDDCIKYSSGVTGTIYKISNTRIK